MMMIIRSEVDGKLCQLYYQDDNGTPCPQETATKVRVMFDEGTWRWLSESPGTVYELPPLNEPVVAASQKTAPDG